MKGKIYRIRGFRSKKTSKQPMHYQPGSYDENSKVTEILKTIGNRRRLRILWELADGKERSVSQIEEVIPFLSQSALSQHLGKLRRAQIVSTRRASQTIFYSLKDQDIIRILKLLHHIYHDDPVLTRQNSH